MESGMEKEAGALLGASENKTDRGRTAGSGRITVCFMILIICLFVMLPVSEVSAKDYKVRGFFESYEKNHSQEYKYSDDYFIQSPDKYDHDFARLSLGMALAAFRDERHKDAQDDNLINFFRSTGFSQIETDTYRKEPTAYSVSYGLAMKKIGDTNVLACAVCGGNYGEEWASNLTIGDLLRSKGFEDSAKKVRKGIDDYLRRHASGRTKLWIAGYSRAGAISNLTAADCTEDGIFEAVYAYTFATPRTTRKPVAYPNIHNIMQKEDVVPKVPFEDWGYERYGKDLYMVSPETDPQCGPVMKKTAENYRRMVGEDMVTNAEIDYQLRTLLDYLLLMMPEPATYTRYLQPLLVDIMTDDDETKDALKVLLTALNRLDKKHPEVGRELDAMRDYVGTLVDVYYLQGRLKDLPADKWDPKLGPDNLFNAHLPYEYLSKMFATDDPDELFTKNREYVRIIVYGEADISVFAGKKELKKILSDGTELVNGKKEPYSFPDADCYDEKAVITLPTTGKYEIRVKSVGSLPQTISYTGLLYSGHTIRAKADDYYSFILYKGDTAVIKTPGKGRAIEPTGSSHTDISVITKHMYSPTTAMKMENYNGMHFTLSGLINRLLLLIVILLVQLIAAIVLAVIRKKKNRKRKPKVTLIWHAAVTLLLVMAEIGLWYYIPILPMAKMIPGALAFSSIFIYALKGCHEGERKWKVFWLFAIVFAAFEILENLLIGDFMTVKAVALAAGYVGFFVLAQHLMWRKKPDKTEGLPEEEADGIIEKEEVPEDESGEDDKNSRENK